MSKRFSRVFGVCMAAAIVVALSGVALAIPHVHPQLTLHAFSPHHKKLSGEGTYYAVNKKVCGHRRRVHILLNGKLAPYSTKTNGQGDYSFTHRSRSRKQMVQTKVNGRIRGRYGHQKICDDALSNVVTVRVK